LPFADTVIAAEWNMCRWDETCERRNRWPAMHDAVKRYLAEIGKKGGSVASKAKAEAARQNGKKGGRSRKKGAK